MRSFGLRRRAMWLIPLLTLPSGGCVVAADALNEGFLLALGIDPNTVQRPPGTIIVSFTNNAAAPATFRLYVAEDASDLTLGVQNTSIEVSSSETRNEVFECPIGLLSPGEVGADFNPNFARAVTVGAAGAAAAMDVPYAGTPLEVSLDYNCGDLIDVRLVVSAAAPGGLALTVEVVPGR